MDKPKPKNDFILKNLLTINKLATACAKRVSKRFPDYPEEDIYNDAMEGIIQGIRKASDPDHISAHYLYKWGYSCCLHAAIRMTGLYYLRKYYRKGKYETEEDIPVLQFHSHEELELMETNHEVINDFGTFSESFEDDTIRKLSLDLIKQKLGDHKLETLFLLLLSGKDKKEICKVLKIDNRTCYYISAKLNIRIQEIFNADDDKLTAFVRTRTKKAKITPPATPHDDSTNDGITMNLNQEFLSQEKINEITEIVIEDILKTTDDEINS